MSFIFFLHATTHLQSDGCNNDSTRHIVSDQKHTHEKHSNGHRSAWPEQNSEPSKHQSQAECRSSDRRDLPWMRIWIYRFMYVPGWFGNNLVVVNTIVGIRSKSSNPRAGDVNVISHERHEIWYYAIQLSLWLINQLGSRKERPERPAWIWLAVGSCKSGLHKMS